MCHNLLIRIESWSKMSSVTNEKMISTVYLLTFPFSRPTCHQFHIRVKSLFEMSFTTFETDKTKSILSWLLLLFNFLPPLPPQVSEFAVYGRIIIKNKFSKHRNLRCDSRIVLINIFNLKLLLHPRCHIYEGQIITNHKFNDISNHETTFVLSWSLSLFNFQPFSYFKYRYSLQSDHHRESFQLSQLKGDTYAVLIIISLLKPIPSFQLPQLAP